MHKQIILAACLIFSFYVGKLSADESCPYTHFKKVLEDKGLLAELVYTGDVAVNTRGGIERDMAYVSSVDLTLTLDTDKAGLWKNGKFYVYMLSSHRSRPLTGELVGDLQGVDNIEVSRTTRLLEAWYEQLFLDSKFSILVGLQDMNSEFGVTDYGLLFINSSFGLQPDISLNARPSFYPLTGPSARFKFTPNERWEFLLGVYDGDSGNADKDKHLPRSILASDQGIFTIAETAFHVGLKENQKPGTYKLGVWYNSGDFEDVVDVDDFGDPVKHEGNIGGYVVVDQMVYREKDEQGLGLFLQAGGAKKEINEVAFYVGGGLNYKGLIPGRDQDETGLAVAYASINDQLVQAGGRDHAETVLEMTYRSYVAPWLVVQPDVQYVVNPGATDGVKNALVTFLRFEIHL